jgi:hypothetical protein
MASRKNGQNNQKNDGPKESNEGLLRRRGLRIRIYSSLPYP